MTAPWTRIGDPFSAEGRATLDALVEARVEETLDRVYAKLCEDGELSETEIARALKLAEPKIREVYQRDVAAMTRRMLQ